MNTPAWVPGNESKPAPGSLLRVQALVNTRDLDSGTDLLEDATTARAWLRAVGLLGSRTSLDDEELQQVRAVRESLRTLLAHNAGDPRPSATDLRALDELTRQVRPRLELDRDGRLLLGSEPGGRVRERLLGLLLEVRDAQADGTWSRLKACGNPGCRWAFYDRSHSRRGAWCDMAACGNKIKNRNLRARKGRAAPAL
jgi:predicted RNA-binding Zn ribbon-like protein